MRLSQEEIDILKRQYSAVIKKMSRVNETIIKAEKNKCSLGMKKMMLESIKELISESKSWLLCKPLANAIITRNIKAVDKKIKKQTDMIDDTCLKGNYYRRKVLKLNRTISTRQLPIM